jgi:hypothetical protein
LCQFISIESEYRLRNSPVEGFYKVPKLSKKPPELFCKFQFPAYFCIRRRFYRGKNSAFFWSDFQCHVAGKPWFISSFQKGTFFSLFTRIHRKSRSSQFLRNSFIACERILALRGEKSIKKWLFPLLSTVN